MADRLQGTEPESPFLLIERDPAHGTWALTNGRVQLSVWAGELDELELQALRDQLDRGAAIEADRGDVAGIISGGKLRQLEEAGYRVVKDDQHTTEAQ